MAGRALADVIVAYLRQLGGVTNLSQSDLLHRFGPLPTQKELQALGYTHSYNDNLMAYMSVYLDGFVFLLDSDGAYLVDSDGSLLIEAI